MRDLGIPDLDSDGGQAPFDFTGPLVTARRSEAWATAS